MELSVVFLLGMIGGACLGAIAVLMLLDRSYRRVMSRAEGAEPYAFDVLERHMDDAQLYQTTNLRQRDRRTPEEVKPGLNVEQALV